MKNGIKDRIIKKVNDAIDEISEKFKESQQDFFTENDIVCVLHSLEKYGKDIYYSYNGNKILLLHCEYPTP